MTITRHLVVSYTTFSPLPYKTLQVNTYKVLKKAVIFFCRHLLSPIASIFGSEVLYAARTFLSHKMPAAEPGHYFLFAKIIQIERI